MSDFKFACPVCGQHMRCDVAEGGSMMECPTCFQKIVAPQSPAADGKFILTGTKYSEKKISVRGLDPASATAAPEKEVPVKIFIIVLAVCLAAGAAVLLYHANKPKPVQPKPPLVSQTPLKKAAVTNVIAPTNPVAVAPPQPKPPTVAPPASDKNWTLSLDEMTFPNSTVVGRIHGLDFIVGRAWYQNGELNLRTSSNAPVELGMRISFSGATAESLTNKTMNISADVDQSAPLTLFWKDGAGLQKEVFKDGYALRLEFDAVAKGRLSGKIYLCTPDKEKSYLMGKFSAGISKPPAPKPKPPTNKPAPAKKTG